MRDVVQARAKRSSDNKTAASLHRKGRSLLHVLEPLQPPQSVKVELIKNVFVRILLSWRKRSRSTRSRGGSGCGSGSGSEEGR